MLVDLHRSRRKPKRISQRIALALVFFISSFVLIVNNSTQLFQSYNLLNSFWTTTIPIIGLVISSIWIIILTGLGEFE